MKILRKGTIDKNKIKLFECPECGCLFEATKNEYKTNFYKNKKYAYCDCPCCDYTIIGEKRNIWQKLEKIESEN